MTDIVVGLSKPYTVSIGAGILDNVGEIAKRAAAGAKKALIVSDGNVAPLYLSRIKNAFQKSGFKANTFSFEAGEENKNFKTYENILETAALLKLTREDIFVAVGGGVVGDITGFAASSYMRGAGVVQIPTTLLAGIDASIGGKTGLDMRAGKNLAGAFHQPLAVVFDTDTLNTLPDREWQNGLGEGIKYAVLTGGPCFDILNYGIQKSNIERFSALCAEYKAKIVAADEKECGERKLLNLGHTVGHALETLSGYTMEHGVAVAKGLFCILKGALKCGNVEKKDYDRIAALYKKYDFDTSLPYGKQDILQAVLLDKKMASDGKIAFVDICGIGNCAVKVTSVASFGEYAL